MMSASKRVFFVGLGLLQDVVEKMLNDQENLEVVGTAHTWEAAKSQIAHLTPNVIIVAHHETEISESELNEIPYPIKIIYLTPTENRIIIHDRQQISDAALPDLIEALNYGESD